jgi:5-formyltetrahydrofolate cyclo-ligase
MSAQPPAAAAKAELRRRVRGLRDALPAQWREAASTAIVRRLLALPAVDLGATVLSYCPFGAEVAIGPINRAILEGGGTLLLPRVDPASRLLGIFRVRDLDRDLTPGTWGIPEPDPDRCDAVSEPAPGWVLVPGLAFDRTGRRLGYGAGYYDRLLARLPGVLRIAVAFSMQVVDHIPVDAHDLPIDTLITETQMGSDQGNDLF